MMVFPAHAGMFLSESQMIVFIGGFPRARGDVPQSPSSSSHRIRFSPRTRGCSDEIDRGRELVEVFPACAGMFPVCSMVFG